MWRYIRAFFKALAMTVRGEKPTTPAQRLYPRLFTWLEGGAAQVRAVYTTADRANFDKPARERVSVKIDGRPTSAETLLGGVRYHLTEEYPYMLRHLTEHSLTGIYASNLNDQYWLETLATSDDLPPEVLASIELLRTHLADIPPSNDLNEL